MGDLFENDPKDRKRRFLRGLNFLLGLGYYNLENKDTTLEEAINLVNCKGLVGLRDNLANFYGLEFTVSELIGLFQNNMATGEFTEKYCESIYRDRGDVDLNTLVRDSMTVEGAIDLREMNKAPKYGLNGNQWCDVAEGPCSCGAWHK